MSRAQIFTGISELVSLAGAAKKDGRRCLESDLSIQKKAAMMVRNGRIEWLGSSQKVPKEFNKISRYDLGGAVVLPGFVECHTHSLFAGSRSQEFEWRQTGVSYQEIAARGGGIKSTSKATRAATPRQLTELLQLRVREFLRQGVTTLEVKTGYGLDEKSELKSLQVLQRFQSPVDLIPTFLGAHAIPSEFASEADYLNFLMKNLLPKIKKKKLAKRVDIFIEKGFFSDVNSRKYLQDAKDLGFEILIHADQLSLSGGTTLGVELGALSVDHVLQIGDAEIRKLASSKTTAVLLPLSDLYMKCNYPPARALIDQGARIALATDFNPGTCPSQDLSLCGLLARLEMKMSLTEVLVAYTLGAASALGLASSRGSLEVGKRADFISINGSWDQLFYSAGQSSVTNTWIQGVRQFPLKN